MLVFNRVAPGPNNALKVAAYSGQKDSSCSFLIRVSPGPNSTLNVATWAEDR